MDLFRVHSVSGGGHTALRPRRPSHPVSSPFPAQYYIYSLNAFVTIFMRSIDLVSGDNDPDNIAAAAEAAAEEEKEDAVLASARLGDAPAADGGVLSDAEGEGAGKVAEDAAAPAAAAAPESAPAAEAKEAEAEAPPPRPPTRAVRVLTDEELVRRCVILQDSATKVTFHYVNRGLFNNDKLTVVTQLCFKLLQDSGELKPQQVLSLVIGPTFTGDPGSMGSLAEWLPETIWPKIKGLEAIKPVFEKLGDDMQNDSSKWRAWFDDEKPETLPLPGEYKNTVSPFNQLLLLRATRPDRLAAALRTFVADKLGQEYVVGRPFDMKQTYRERESEGACRHRPCPPPPRPPQSSRRSRRPSSSCSSPASTRRRGSRRSVASAATRSTTGSS